MRIEVLGRLRVVDERGTSFPTVPKPRQVLAVLASNAGRIVPTSVLMRELWEGEPPRTAVTTLQTYVGQLRRVLAEASTMEFAEIVKHVLVTETGGYGLVGTEIDSDLADYERLLASAKAAIAGGDDALGVRRYQEALDVWSGPALVNVDVGPVLRGLVHRLEESRLCVRERLIVADMRLGEHQSVISELVELTAAHPQNESLHGHLMLAFYRSGRRSEALAVFQQLRQRLVNEVGLEPSADLLRLQRAILTADPELSDPERTLSASRAS